MSDVIYTQTIGRRPKRMNAIQYLSGKKTYIVAFLMACLAFAYQVEWLDEHTFKTIEALLLASGLTTTRAAIGKVTVLLLCFTGVASAQIQIMAPEKEQLLRSYIPKIADKGIAEKISQALLYTDEEIPPAYQFQELAGGTGVGHTQFYTVNHRHNRIDKYTHGNLEFPWADPGGLNHVDPSMVYECRFLWLPPKPNGGVHPVALYQGPLEKSRAVNMPVPLGDRWIYPVGTLVGEVLLKKFTNGTWAPYEVRIRARELTSWEVEVYRPFATAEQLSRVLPEGAFKNTGVWKAAMVDQYHHTESAFAREGANLILPTIPNARELLMKTSFQPVGGSIFARTADYQVEALTAEDDDNIVPAKYNSAYMGTTAETCANCHQHVLRHVDSFDTGRDWYGYIRGSDGIFSFHPIALDAIRPRGNGPKRPREVFVQAGIVEEFNANKHDKNIYQRISTYDNPPRSNQPKSRMRIQGGR